MRSGHIRIWQYIWNYECEVLAKRPFRMLQFNSFRVFVFAAAVTALGSSLAHAAKSLPVPGPLASAPAAGEVTLTWRNISGETGYLVERRIVGAAGFAEIAKLGTDVTQFQDKVANTGQLEYRVRAYRVLGGRMLYSGYTNTAYSALPCS